MSISPMKPIESSIPSSSIPLISGATDDQAQPQDEDQGHEDKDTRAQYSSEFTSKKSDSSIP